MVTSAGQQVLVDEASSTTYQNGTTSITVSGVAKGEGVLVLGTTSGATISAMQVIVDPTGVGITASSSSSAVIPFTRGAPTASKQEGQFPANWGPGSGTIIGGTAANKATEVALAAYPGGIVDRVVRLSNGEYTVHYIGATGRTTSSSTKRSRSSAPSSWADRVSQRGKQARRAMLFARVRSGHVCKSTIVSTVGKFTTSGGDAWIARHSYPVGAQG
jgi:hypothetical protein